MKPKTRPRTPQQLTLRWKEEATPVEELADGEKVAVIEHLARLLLEASGAVNEERTDEEL